MTTQGTSVRKWSRADFLDRAHELKRRLEVWHIDGAEPVYAPRDVASRMRAERQTFRDRVMAGEHNPDPDFEAWNLLEEGGAAKAIRRPKDPYSKTITVWEFRDFVEHLRSDAGDSDAAKLVGLKLERLLDAPMHKRARNEVFGDHIVGRAVDPSLIQEFVEAVRALSNTSETSGADPSPEAVQDPKPNKTELDSLSDSELTVVLAKIIEEDPRKRWTASKLVPEVENRRPGRRTSDTSIGQNLIFKRLLEKQGRNRRRRIKTQNVEDLEQVAGNVVAKSYATDRLSRLVEEQAREDAADQGSRRKGRRARSAN